MLENGSNYKHNARSVELTQNQLRKCNINYNYVFQNILFCQISGSHRVADKRLKSYKKLHHVNWQLFTADIALTSQII
jgi:hypothetical protein